MHILLALLWPLLLVGACASTDTEPLSSPTVFTFAESGVYRLPAAEGALQRGQQPLPLWQSDTSSDPITFFYAPVTATRHSMLSALFWDAQTAAAVATPAPLPALSATDAQTTAEQLYWQEEDNSYQSEVDLERPWLWTRIIAPGQWQDTITVPAGATAPFTLTVRLWAKTAMPTDPDHHVQLLWDDALVGDETWDGAGLHTLSVPLLAAAPGQHTLTINLPGDTAALAEVVYIDGWGLAFQRPLDIRQEPATWSATAAAARIQTNPDQPMWLLDITDPGDLLDPTGFADECTYDDRYDYEDPVYTGAYDLWLNCGGTDTAFVELEAYPPNEEFVVFVQIQIVTEADFEALDTILATFDVSSG